MENQGIDNVQVAAASSDYIVLAYLAAALILGWMVLRSVLVLKRSRAKLLQAESRQKS